MGTIRTKPSKQRESRKGHLTSFQFPNAAEDGSWQTEQESKSKKAGYNASSELAKPVARPEEVKKTPRARGGYNSHKRRSHAKKEY